MLSKLGYTDVIACKHGEEVLEAIDQYGCKHFDTILMDCSMPILDGKECTRRIREHEKSCDKHCHPYIIAQTGHVTPDAVKECYDSGMSDYTQKPIQLEALSAALKRAYEAKVKREAAEGASTRHTAAETKKDVKEVRCEVEKEATSTSTS